MKIAVVFLSIVSIVMLAFVVLVVMPGSPLVTPEAPQDYDMGFIDGCIGGISLSLSKAQRPPYEAAYNGCQQLLDKVEGEERPLAKPPVIQKSHAEELEEQGIEVFHTVWRS